MNKSYVILAICIAVIIGLSVVYVSEVEIPATPKPLEGGHYHDIQVSDKVEVGEKHG